MQRFPCPFLLGDIGDDDQVGYDIPGIAGQGCRHNPSEFDISTFGPELQVVGGNLPPGHPPGKVARHLQLALPGQEGEAEEMFPQDLFPGEPEPVKEPVVHLQEPAFVIEDHYRLGGEFEDPPIFFFAFFEGGNGFFGFPQG